MKKTKKILSIFLAIIMLISIFSITASAATYLGTCGKNVTCAFDESTGTLTISGKGPMYNFLSNRPWENYKNDIKHIVVEDGVTFVALNEFYGCYNIIDVTIPVSVTEIARYVFDNETYANFKGIYYEGTIAQWRDIDIGEDYPFEIHPFESVKVHCEYELGDFKCSVVSPTQKTIKITGYNVYQAKYNGRNPLIFETIKIPSEINGYTVTEIGDSVFYYHESISNVEIPDTVTKIGDYAFYRCYNLETITIPDGVTTIGGYAFYDCDGIKEIEIPDNVKIIDEYAFYHCDGIQKIEMPDSVTTIGNYAFGNCHNLQKVVLSDNVTTIGERAFYNCSAIKEIVIPGSVTTMGDLVFYSCDNLNKVMIVDGVTTIGNYTFEDCDSLETVIIGDSVTTIGNYAFYNCSAIKEIVIPDSVTSIGNYAFRACSNLKKIIIPDTVKIIGDSSFYYCNNLADVYYDGTEEQWEAISISSNNSPLINATIHFDHKNNHTPADREAGIYTAPTCTEKGYTTYTCSECGMEYKDDYVDATGHDSSYVLYISPPCTEKGYTIYECHCGASALRDFVDVTGHIDSDSDGHCDQCNRNTGGSVADAPTSDVSGIFSIFNIILELLEKLISSFGFLKV